MSFAEIKKFIKDEIDRYDRKYEKLGHSREEVEMVKKQCAFSMVRVLAKVGVLNDDEEMEMVGDVLDMIEGVE